MNNETLADILDEMRQHIQAARDYPQDIDITTGDVEDWADRLEAAAKRERAERHDYELAECERCDRANAAAMRAALEEQLRYWDTHVRTRDEEEMRVRTEAALAAPPRNCDVGTAEEQAERKRKFCKSHWGTNDMSGDNCRMCPLSPFDCSLAWALLPYEAKGGAE